MLSELNSFQQLYGRAKVVQAQIKEYSIPNILESKPSRGRKSAPVPTTEGVTINEHVNAFHNQRSRPHHKPSLALVQMPTLAYAPSLQQLPAPALPHDAQIRGRGRCFHSNDGPPEFSPVDASCFIQVIYPIPKLKADRDSVSRCPMIGTIPTSVYPRRRIFGPRRQIKDPMGLENYEDIFQGFWKRGIMLPLLPQPRIGIGWGYTMICSMDKHRPGLLSRLHICGKSWYWKLLKRGCIRQCWHLNWCRGRFMMRPAGLIVEGIHMFVDCDSLSGWHRGRFSSPGWLRFEDVRDRVLLDRVLLGDPREPFPSFLSQSA